VRHQAEFQALKVKGAKERNLSQEKVSLITVKDPKKNTLNIAMIEEDKVYEVKIRMDQVNGPDQINFHKQALEVADKNFQYSESSRFSQDFMELILYFMYFETVLKNSSSSLDMYK
jgi:hypothetical protein